MTFNAAWTFINILLGDWSSPECECASIGTGRFHGQDSGPPRENIIGKDRFSQTEQRTRIYPKKQKIRRINLFDVLKESPTIYLTRWNGNHFLKMIPLYWWTFVNPKSNLSSGIKKTFNGWQREKKNRTFGVVRWLWEERNRGHLDPA